MSEQKQTTSLIFKKHLKYRNIVLGQWKNIQLTAVKVIITLKLKETTKTIFRFFDTLTRWSSLSRNLFETGGSNDIDAFYLSFRGLNLVMINFQLQQLLKTISISLSNIYAKSTQIKPQIILDLLQIRNFSFTAKPKNNHFKRV